MLALLGAGAGSLELWAWLLYIVGSHSFVGGVIFAWAEPLYADEEPSDVWVGPWVWWEEP